MMRHASLVPALCGLSVVLSTTLLSAQVQPGQYLATVSVGPAPARGEMYYLDPATQKATALTLPTALQSDPVNCVAMLNNSVGWVGTIGVAGSTPSNLYRITLAGTTVTASQINNTATAGYNLSQITRIGGILYFATQDAAGANGVLQSVPLAGGNVTTVVDFSKVSGWRSGGVINAVASNGNNKVYIAVWTLGEVYEYDVPNQSTKLLMTLPATKYSSTATAYYPVNMHMKEPAATSNTLAVFGLYGDLVEVDTTTAKVANHWYHPTAIAASGMTTTKNSCYWNADLESWGVGSRDGSLDILIPTGTGHLGRRDVDNVGSNTTLTQNSVNGLYYNPAGASYAASGQGCAGAGGFFPTSVGRGAPLKGAASFAFGLDGAMPSTAAVLLLGINNSAPFPVDLTALGAPGCFLRNDLLGLIPAPTTGVANGLGFATVPAPLPNAAFTLHTQWMVLDKSNSLGLVFSDGRTVVVK